MSNIFSNNSKLDKKVIGLKPIQFIKEEDNTETEVINQNEDIQMKVQKGYEELQQIKEQKESLLHETDAQIEEAKQKWESEKQQYIEEAKNKGYNEGFTSGKQDSLNQYKELIAKANSIVELANADYHATVEKSEETILELGIKTAEKLIKQHISQDRNSFLEIVKAAIKEIKDQSNISIYLHPDNYEYVLQQKDEICRILDTDTKVSIYINEDLEENGCLIKHPYGQIDASIDTQLIQLRQVLSEISMEQSP
ncbi:flagellar assembly protein FliH [Virgibacillus byunsanensis]|uniref:Flagellar assembly protein FliH n=1 Tax=Virgibacillus byunsanensis TaxID=570945 RepID=A0ABW3LHX2_9BACI